MSRSTTTSLTLAALLVVCPIGVAEGKAGGSQCRWGGLTDSRGHRVRCLTKSEAQDLARTGARDDAAAETRKAEQADTPDADEPPRKKRLPAVEVRTTFQRGQTNGATPRLSKNAYLYARCVADNGGLKRAVAEVRIRFQVSRSGRAQNVSISKRRSVAPSAARCIAEAINGAYVGVPTEQPTVGTAVLRLR